MDELVGRPKEFGNLAVFPILAKHQVDVGPMTSLESALAKGEAEVREVPRALCSRRSTTTRSRKTGLVSPTK